MAAEDINIGEKLNTCSVGDLIYSVAMGIAKAQWELNKSSMVSAELMSGSRILRNLKDGTPLLDNTGKVQRDDTRVYFGFDYTFKPDGSFSREPKQVSMLELGFTPTFYQFMETVIEVKVAIKIHREVKTNRTGKDDSKQTAGTLAVASSVDATYSQSYNYSAEGSSLVRTKLVPVPPPAILEERIRLVMNGEKQVQALFQGQLDSYLAERANLLKQQKVTKDALAATNSGLPEHTNLTNAKQKIDGQIRASDDKLNQLQAAVAAEKLPKPVIPTDLELLNK